MREGKTAQSAVENGVRILAGQCLCRAVTYTVADAFEYAMYCHCSNCRRTTGSAFKALAGVRSSQFCVTNGQDALLIYGPAKAHDAHCGRCGSLLYSVVRDGAYVHVALGALLDEPSVRPSMHIFVGSKAPWYVITDALPQYREFPGE